MVGRLDKWRILRESTEPIVVLIGGATGVGTSTLAADVARRLNIQSVVGTDSIREVLRRAISPDLLPLLHKSSYEIKREDLRVPVEEDEMVLYGFRQQASQVAVGVEAIVDRGLKEGTNLVIEGVHLVPEIILNRYRDHPNVCTLVVYLSDEHVHRARFYIRALGTAMRRPAEEYISYFREIRQIHDYIRRERGQGRRAGGGERLHREHLGCGRGDRGQQGLGDSRGGRPAGARDAPRRRHAEAGGPHHPREKRVE